jgi:hypothetical protein
MNSFSLSFLTLAPVLAASTTQTIVENIFVIQLHYKYTVLNPALEGVIMRSINREKSLILAFIVAALSLIIRFDLNAQEPPPAFDDNCADDVIQIRYYAHLSMYEIRLEDMDIFSTILGLRALETPTLNGLKNSGWFGWGTSVKVYSRVQLLNSTEVWYQVGLASSSTPAGWIPVKYGSVFFVGSTPDPCLLYVSTHQNYVFNEFRFNRRKAAAYAVYNSYRNSLVLPPPLRVTGRRPATDPIHFADFWYSLAPGSGTPSAVFVSEAFWMGGLPMTNGRPTSCTDSLTYDITHELG